MRSSCILAGLLGLLLCTVSLLRAQSAAGEHALSPTVWASWVAGVDAAGTPEHLQIVVLWRGAPHWYQAVNGGSSTMGPTGAMEFEYRLEGGRTLRWRFDPQSRTVWLNGQEVTTDSANVLLIDGADERSGPVIVGTTSVDPQLASATDATTPHGFNLRRVLQQLPEVQSFLR